ncbi:uncharacterized protein V6R79_010562 [Siganus canaliculatus]
MTDAEQGFRLLKQTFDKYAAKDGDPTTLTKKELADLLRSELPASAAFGFPQPPNVLTVLHYVQARKTIRQLLDNVGGNVSGELVQETEQFTCNRCISNIAIMELPASPKKAFDAAAGEDGLLDRKELRAVLCRCTGKDVPAEVAEKFFKAIDSDADGGVTYDEFMVFLQKLQLML